MLGDGAEQQLLAQHVLAQQAGAAPQHGVVGMRPGANLLRRHGLGHGGRLGCRLRRRSRRYGVGRGHLDAEPLGPGLLQLDELAESLGEAGDGVAAAAGFAQDEVGGAAAVLAQPALEHHVGEALQAQAAGLGGEIEDVGPGADEIPELRLAHQLADLGRRQVRALGRGPDRQAGGDAAGEGGSLAGRDGAHGEEDSHKARDASSYSRRARAFPLVLPRLDRGIHSATLHPTSAAATWVRDHVAERPTVRESVGGGRDRA